MLKENREINKSSIILSSATPKQAEEDVREGGQHMRFIWITHDNPNDFDSFAKS